MTSWNSPKVIMLNIRWKTPIEISPLKMGTKKPKKKYVHEYPAWQYFSTPDCMCFTLNFFYHPRKMLPSIKGEKINKSRMIIKPEDSLIFSPIIHRSVLPPPSLTVYVCKINYFCLTNLSFKSLKVKYFLFNNLL